MKKKILAGILSVVMILSLIPMTVFAGEGNVCKIGGTEYATLTEAIAAVPTDGTETTITLIDNINLEQGVVIDKTKNIVLELNGKILSGVSTQSGNTALITNRGTLIVQDNTDVNKDGTGTGRITNEAYNTDLKPIPTYGSYTIENCGILTLESGIVESTTSSGAATYAIDNSTSPWDGSPYVELNIKGGLVIRSSGDAIRQIINNDDELYGSKQHRNNVVNISGGTIIGDSALWVQVTGSEPEGSLNISGGEFVGLSGIAISDSDHGGTYNNVSYNITNGRFKGIMSIEENSKFVSGGIFGGVDTYSWQYAGICDSEDNLNIWLSENVELFGGKIYTISTYNALPEEIQQSYGIKFVKDKWYGTQNYYVYEYTKFDYDEAYRAYFDEYLVNSKYYLVPNTDSKTKEDYPWMLGLLNPVAKIGDKEYGTLAEAIMDVPTDGTETLITLVGDECIAGNVGVTIAKTKNIVLDLNGHTLSNLVNEDTHSQVINNKGTLTIKDSTDTNADGTGSGLITNAVEEGTSAGDWWSDPRQNWTTNLIENNGTVTILSGKLLNTAEGSICYAVDNNSADETLPKCYIKGGLLENDNYTPVRVAPTETNLVEFEMTGGIIKGLYGIAFNTNSRTAPKLNFSIKDGQIKATSYAIYTSGGSSITDVTNLNLDLYNGIVGVVGEPSSNLVSFSWKNGELKFIRGGLFTGDVSTNVKDGFACAQIGDDLYIVGIDAESSDNKLTKGLFNVNPVAYVAENHSVKASGNQEYPYEVYETATPQIEIVVEHPAITEVGEKVDSGEKEVAKEVLDKAAVTGVVDALTEKGQEQLIKDAEKTNEDLHPAIEEAKQTQIDIAVETVAVEVKTVKTVEATKEVITFELTPYAVVTAIASDGTTVSSEKVLVDNDYLSKNNVEPITVVLGTTFEPEQVLHIRENGEIEAFKAGDVVSHKNKTYVYDETAKTVTLQILDFSEVKLLATALEEYDVSFDANGGSGTMEAQKIVYGSAFYLPTCEFTAPTNKVFKGWRIGLKEYAPGDKIEITEDTKIKAVWKELNPDTGDHNNIGLFVGLGGFALLGIIALAVVMLKRKPFKK